MNRAVLLLLALGPIGCHGPLTLDRRAQSATASVHVRGRETATAEDPEPLQALGLVVPRYSVDVASTVAGTIGELKVGLGDRIELDAPVALLRNAELTHAARATEASARASRASVLQADSTRVFSQHRAQQAEALHAHISADEGEARRHDVELSRAAASSARGELEGRRAEVDRLHEQLDALTVRAPFAAEVSAIYRGVGEHVQPGTPILRLVSTERIIRFAVDQAKADRFPIGTHVELVGPNDRVLARAVVAAQSPEVDAAAMVLVEASIPTDAPHGVLRAGSQGHVRENASARIAAQ